MADYVCSYGVRNCRVCRPNEMSLATSAEGIKRLASYNRAVPASHRVYLAVPYAEKDAAKGIGARWDANKRLWYADGREGITRFSKWYRSAKNVAVIESVTEKAAYGYSELMDALESAAEAEDEAKITEVEYVDLPQNINYG